MSKRDQILEETPQEPDAGPSSFFPEPGPGLGKEVKIGLAVILGLLTVFGVVVVKKMRRPPDPPAMAEDPGAKPGNHAADKHGPKDLPPGGSPSRPASPTFVAGKPGSPGLSASSPKWSLAGDSTRSKDSPHDNRAGSPPPSFMPKPPDIVDGPGSHRLARSGDELGNSPPSRPKLGEPMSNRASGTADKPFDPFPKQPAPPTLGNSPPMVQVSDASHRSGPAAIGEGRGNAGRHARPGGPSGTSLAMRDISDTVGGSAPRGPMPPPAAATSPSGDFRPNLSRVSPPDSSVPAPRSTVDSRYPGVHRSSSEPPVSAPHLSATTAAYGGADIPPGPRRHDNDAGRRQDGSYVVQPSDSYWTISHAALRHGRLFSCLGGTHRNKFPDEDRLDRGRRHLGPQPADLERSYPAFAPSRIVARRRRNRRGSAAPRCTVPADESTWFKRVTTFSTSPSTN